jgi:hypothetical protein
MRGAVQRRQSTRGCRDCVAMAVDRLGGRGSPALDACGRVPQACGSFPPPENRVKYPHFSTCMRGFCHGISSLFLPVGAGRPGVAVRHAPCISQPPFPRPSPQGTPEARPSPLLRHLSRPRYTAPRLAAGRSGGAAARLWVHRTRRGQGVAAGGGRWGGAGAKSALNFLSAGKRHMLYNQANPHIAIDLRTAEIRIDGQPLPPLPTEDLPLNRRYFLL